ncbi:PAS domain S-box [Clostridium tetanomorphum DSM 665]|nr:PAS domain S-box [Clostridium tetanomorphum DSM 665]
MDNNLYLQNVENHLILGNTKLQSIFNASSNYYIILDTYLKIHTFNTLSKNNLKSIFEKDLEIGQYIFEYHKDFNSPFFKENLDKALNGVSIDFQLKLTNSFKEDFWFSFNLNPIINESGEIINILIKMIDITENKKFQLALSDSERLYKSSFENSLVGQIHISLHGKLLKFNKAFINMLNYTPEELSNMKIQDLTYNDDIEKTNEILKLICSKEISEFSLEKRYVSKNGQLIFGKISGCAIFNDSDNPIYIISQIEDITDRKIAEKELIKFKKAIENSYTSIAITDKSGTIEYVNPRFSDVTGYSCEEVLGTPLKILKPKETTSYEYNYLLSTINSGKTWRGEFLNIKKNGESYWESAVISPIFDEKNEISNFIVLGEDITVQKNIKNSLYETNQKYTTITQNIPGMIFQLCLSSQGELSFTYVNVAVIKIFNITPTALKTNPNLFLEKIHNEDLDNFKKAFQFSKENFYIKKMKNIFMQKDNIKWIQLDSIPSKMNDDSILWDGIIVDITKHKAI